MQKRSKTLRFNKETLRRISTPQLLAALGGQLTGEVLDTGEELLIHPDIPTDDCHGSNGIDGPCEI